MTSIADVDLRADLPLQITIAAEYFCDPVWIVGQDVMEVCDGSALGLSEQLVGDLRDWSEAYNATYNSADPRDSAPPPADHFVRGFELAERVCAETPSAWIVITKDPESGQDVEVSPPLGGIRDSEAARQRVTGTVDREQPPHNRNAKRESRD